MALQNYSNGITYGAGVGSVVPGVGTVVGGAVGGIIGFITNLFGSKDVANDQFIDGLVAYSQHAGFSGFTHEDVVHLMPGNWGNDYSGASSQFQIYLANGLKYPNQDLTKISGVFSFGGGYYPNHAIVYVPQGAISTVGTTSVIPTGGYTNTSGLGNLSTAGISTPILLFLLIGAGIFLVMANVKH